MIHFSQFYWPFWRADKLESFQENETHKIFWGFKNQTDDLISTRQTDLVIVNKKKKMKSWRRVEFDVPADHKVKIKENKKWD